MARCVFFCCGFCWYTELGVIEFQLKTPGKSQLILQLRFPVFWIQRAGLMDSRWLWISIKRLIQFSDYNALITVQTILPKMREIEGNLKKRYAKLAAQIWLGPCHWIKTQSDIACMSYFPNDIHKKGFCHTWDRLPHLQARIASDWWWSVEDHGNEKKEKRSDVSSVLSFPPSFARERKTSV